MNPMRALRSWREWTTGAWVPVLLAAQREQRAAGHRRIGSEHLLLGLVIAGSGPAAAWLRDHGCEPDGLRRRVRAAVDARAGDPQGVAAEDLAVIGADRLPLRPGAAEPSGRRRRDRDYSAEALAVLHTTFDHARDADATQRPTRRRLLDDDLAVGLATTRGARARDLLHELGIDADELASVARSRRA